MGSVLMLNQLSRSLQFFIGRILPLREAEPRLESLCSNVETYVAEPLSKRKGAPVFNPRILLEGGEEFHIPSHSDSLLQRDAVLMVVLMAEFVGERFFQKQGIP